MATTKSWTTPGEHTWTVPDGVYEIEADIWGASGGSGSGNSTLSENHTTVGGDGGYINATFDVSPGETLYINVGGANGGHGGGGTGGNGGDTASGGDGGGASDVRQGGSTLSDRILVGAGGAGGGAVGGDSLEDHDVKVGGAGGPDNGEDGADAGSGNWASSGGPGGTQSGGYSTGSGEGGDFTSSGDNYEAGSGGAGGGYYGGYSGGVAAYETSAFVYSASAAGSGGGSNYISSNATASSNQRGIRTGDGEVTFTYTQVSAPTAPNNVSLAYDADDQQTLSWDEPDDWGNERGHYEIDISRDAATFIDPSGGPVEVNDDGSASYSATYHPNSDNSYDSQIGMDSEFEFRVRATNSEGSSSWSYSNNVCTSPIPPHNPSASRPSATEFTLSWTNQSDIASASNSLQIQYREDTGGGYGSWTFHTNVDADSGSYSVSTSHADFSTDARYQFRLRSVNRSGSNAPTTSAFVFADYGNANNVFFEDNFEDQDLAEWTTSFTGESGVKDATFLDSHASDDDFSTDNRTMPVQGPDEGSYYLFIEEGDTATVSLGDLSGESDVLVKCAGAVSSADGPSDGEATLLQWYDGASWNTLKTLSWEYNRQNWVEITALVPSSLLSTDNRVRIVGGGGGSGDYGAWDRVVVSDILHEYTTPATPSGLSLDTSVEDEMTFTFTDNAAFAESFDTDYQRTSASSWTHHANLSSTSTTITGLDDGEEYAVRTRAFLGQYRNGSKEGNFTSSFASESAVTRFPAPTSLSADAIYPDAVDLSWVDNADHEDAYRAIVARNETETEDWEDGLTGWTVNDLTQVTDRVYSGSYAAYTNTGVSSAPQASRTFYSGGKQVDFFSCWWQETGSSTGGGVRLVNSNGNYEIGFATDNPQWVIEDANGVSVRYLAYDRYDAAGVDRYNHWVWTGILFDWANTQATVAFWSPSGGVHYTATVPLKAGVDIATVELWEYNGETWGGSGIEMWWDDIWLGSDNSGALAAGSTAYTASGLLNGERYQTKILAETEDAIVEDQ